MEPPPPSAKPSLTRRKFLRRTLWCGAAVAGVGGSGTALRLNCPPEINLLTLASVG